MPADSVARDTSNSTRGRTTKKINKPTAKKTKREMSFTARLDPDVHYHPKIVAELKKMGITLEATPKKQNKIPITIRLDPDVVETLRAMGEGWQPKTNELLRKWLKL